jgi:hypothetical protein
MQDMATESPPQPQRHLPGLRAWEIRRRNIRASWSRRIAIALLGTTVAATLFLPSHVLDRFGLGARQNPGVSVAEASDTLEQVIADKTKDRTETAVSVVTGHATLAAALTTSALPTPTSETETPPVDTTTRKTPPTKPASAPVLAKAQASTTPPPSAWVQEVLSTRFGDR